MVSSGIANISPADIKAQDPIQQASDMVQVLALITKDPKLVQQLIDNYRQAAADLEAAYEAIGPAKEIPFIKRQAQDALAQAHAAISKAQQEAGEILRKAQVDAETIVNEAKGQVKVQQDKLSATLDAVLKAEATRKKVQDETAKTLKDTDEHVLSETAKLNERSQELDKLKSDLNEQLAEVTQIRKDLARRLEAVKQAAA